MTFQEWFVSKKFASQTACAEFLGLHKSTVSRMLADDDYVPDRITAMLLEVKTGKKVKASSWKVRT